MLGVSIFTLKPPEDLRELPVALLSGDDRHESAFDALLRTSMDSCLI